MDQYYENKMSALNSPRFCNTGTFMRMPRFQSVDGLDFAVIGIPFDTGSSFRTGARFGPTSIRNISAMIKPNNIQLEVNVLEGLQGSDYGDIAVIPGYIEPTFEVIERELTPLVKAGVTPICFGGDHSISLAELRVIARQHGPVSLVHFDSHLDLNEKVFGQNHNHGTPFRRAVEEGLIDPYTSVQVGMRGSLYNPDDFKIAASLGFKVITADQVRKQGLEETGCQIIDRVGTKKSFFTFDIDFVDPAYAPGTGTPEVGGFTSYETLSLIRMLKDINFVAFDVVEVLPAYDSSEITAYLAANIGFEFISMLALKKKSSATKVSA
jgi:agmatinase